MVLVVFFEFGHDFLQALFELAAVFGAGDHASQVKHDDALIQQAVRNIFGNNPLRQTFDNGGLTDARLANQHRVILGAAVKDGNDAADLVFTADHRIKLAFARLGGQIGAKKIECGLLAFFASAATACRFPPCRSHHTAAG